MNGKASILLIVLALLVALVSASVFTVDEREFAIKLRFGEILSDEFEPINRHWKIYGKRRDAPLRPALPMLIPNEFRGLRSDGTWRLPPRRSPVIEPASSCGRMLRQNRSPARRSACACRWRVLRRPAWTTL